MCSHKTEVIDGADLQPLDGKRWRQGVKHLLLFLLLSFTAQAQDTSIRPFFLDSNFRYCDSAKARYYGYSLYDCSGKAKSTPTAYMGKNYSIRYYPNSKESATGSLQLLDGTVKYTWTRDTNMYFYREVYNKGYMKEFEDVTQSSNESKRNVLKIYFDSLYQSQPLSYLAYTMRQNIMLYKEYGGTEEEVPRVYFVSHREFRYLNRLCIGYYGTAGNGLKEGESPREFGELGYSRKFIHGWYCDSTKRNYDRNLLLYKAINASFLVSPGKKGLLTGQRATLSYVGFIYRVEAGLVNYTDFKKWDPRFTFGGGMSILHWVNIQFNWSVPLTNHTFDDVGKISLGIFIN